MDIKKWDLRFLELAKNISSWSKDPSTKCGAIIVRPDKTVCSVGFNGFPKGTDDNIDLYKNRDIKLSRIIHSEMNAILFACEKLDNYTLYVWPFQPCSRCASHIIQVGIKRVVTINPDEDQKQRWGDSFKESSKLFENSGVILDILN